MPRPVPESDAADFLLREGGELAVRTRDAVLAADPDLSERLYPGWRGVGYRHPEAGYVCGIFPQPDGEVRLLFEHGAALPDPDGVLQGSGTQTRYVVVGELDPELVARYVQQAIGQRLLR
jgi:hypothetical protein